MLVCNVSQREWHTTMAAAIAEIAVAVDATAIENVGLAADVSESTLALDALGTGIVFATLVDDPASVGEHVDAFFGQIVQEAANASSAVSAGFGYAGTVAETVIAGSAQDGTVAAGGTATTWNTADRTANMTLSGGNLTATASGGGSQGVRCTAGRSGAKVYFEILYNAVAGGGTTFSGIALATANFTSWVGSGTGGIGMFDNGTVFRNGAAPGVNIGAIAAGKRHCIAVDMAGKLFWARVDAGNWNGSSSNNPATGVGGIDISAVFTTTLNAFAAYGTASASNNCTVNFGATAFAQTVPSGFAAWT